MQQLGAAHAHAQASHGRSSGRRLLPSAQRAVIPQGDSVTEEEEGLMDERSVRHSPVINCRISKSLSLSLYIYMYMMYIYMYIYRRGR